MALKTGKYHGPVEKTINLQTNDPAKPNVKLVLKAEIVGSAIMLPAETLIFPSPSDWEYAGRVLIRKEPSESGELKLTNVHTSSEWLTAKARRVERVEPATADLPEAVPGDWIIDVGVTESAPLGRNSAQVTFDSGLPREPNLSLWVRMDVSRAMEAKPDALVLRLDPGASEAQAKVQVRVRPGLAQEQLQAAAPGPFQVAVARPEARHFEVTVGWKGGGDAPRSGELKLSLGGETVAVPLQVRDRRVPAAATR